MTALKAIARPFFALATLTLSLQSPALADVCPGRPDRVASSANDICPLLVGNPIPTAEVRDIDGKALQLDSLTAGNAVVLIFYRGGWCPFCNLQLGQLATIVPELRELGYRIIALSADRSEKLVESRTQHSIDYALVSDSDMNAARAFGIAFRVDDETVSAYKDKFHIDLEASSDRTHHQLPVPAVFVAGADGVIQFAYVNPNYKVRVEPTVLIAAARAALKPGATPPTPK